MKNILDRLQAKHPVLSREVMLAAMLACVLLLAVDLSGGITVHRTLQDRLVTALAADGPVDIGELEGRDWGYACIITPYATNLLPGGEGEPDAYNRLISILESQGQSWFLNGGSWGMAFMGDDWVDLAVITDKSADLAMKPGCISRRDFKENSGELTFHPR